MRVRHNPIDALAALAKLANTDERRVYWRQALTALGEPGRVESPPPLDGLAPDVVVQAAQKALEAGLLEDLDWATPERAAMALYELTSALPPGPERHAFGKRMFAQLYQGKASTFAAVATRMAVSSPKPLETPALRARVHLLYSLPVGSSVNADALALTLVARRELFERWVAAPAVSTLPARRMAAVILERAAREAVLRVAQGDPGARAVFFNARVLATYKTLLADREPLVWRHAAVARGLLAGVEPAFREEVDLELDPALTPTEWRRAVVSLVACLTHDYETAFAQCKSVIGGELAARHPALLSTLVWGLEPLIDTEPDQAEELLEVVSTIQRVDVAETLVALLSDVQPASFGRRAAERMRALLERELSRADQHEQMAIEATLKLFAGKRHDTTIVGAVRAALLAFENTGARSAYEIALGALARAGNVLETLEAVDANTPESILYETLVNLDTGAIESARLYELLLLGRRPGDANASVAEMEKLYDRFGDWLLSGPGAQVAPASAAPWQKRKWLSLLHLIDVETARRSGNEHIATRVAWRIQCTIRTLVARLAHEGDSKLHRVFCATLARAFDAAVREGVAEATDLMLLACTRLHSPATLLAVVDASTTEDVRQAFDAYAGFLEIALPAEPVIELTLDDGGWGRFGKVVVALASGVNTNCSYRGEALRQALLRIARGLEALEGARSLADLGDAEEGGVSDLERACFDLRRLLAGACARLLDEPLAVPSAVYTTGEPLSVLIEQALSSGTSPEQGLLERAVQDLAASLPAPFAAVLQHTLQRVSKLPLEASSTVASRRSQRSSPLPDWLLPRRTIGGFYVVSSLGSGGASSVFVARRIEARHQTKAELYALKVPKYDPAIARSLSEQQFFDLFREEAGALLALPKHPNLARFVNFDVEARPKPILVMELIRGDSLERLLRRGGLTVHSAIQYLTGILEGLHAMHSVGVGHLDLKPANVILRDEATAVLVDFGLSGRHIRPGCGTLDYCAPEVLGVVPQGYTPSPAATDVYAFACLAFETLTNRNLVEGNDETSMIANHVEHDGWPARLAEFSRVDGARDLAMLLARCMRRDPRLRPTALEVGRALAPAAHALSGLPGPLPSSRKDQRLGGDRSAAAG